MPEKHDSSINLVRADGSLLNRLLDAGHRLWPEGLDRRAYGRLDAALTKTPWGSRCRGRFALVDRTHLLASALQYDLEGWLEGRAVRACGIGTIVTDPARHGLGHASALVERLLARAAEAGAELAVLFRRTGRDEEAFPHFKPLPVAEVTLEVAESERHGAPMTMIRAGEERDLAAIVAMGRIRAEPFRFHLDRDADFVRYAATRKRLIAGLGAPGARQLYFFIAEEGITAAAYIVVSVEGRTWTVEECGDRDPSGARVGALLQGLIARERTERPLSIRAWLPPGFVPPQVTITSATPSADVVMTRALAPHAARASLGASNVLYWRNDVF